MYKTRKLVKVLFY